MSAPLLLAGILACLPQDPGSEPDPEGQDEASEAPPFVSYREREMARLEDDVQGAWILLSYETPRQLLDRRDVQGFATFKDGRLVLILQAVGEGDRLLGPELTYAIHAGVHHYRVSPQLALQTSAIMEQVVHPDDDPPLGEPATLREYNLRVLNDELVLTHLDGTRMVFRRTRAGTFPLATTEELARFPTTTPPPADLPPEPEVGDGGDEARTLRTLRGEQLADLEEAIEANWVLREFTVPGERFEDGEVRGHMGFTDGYMVLVVNAGFPEPDGLDGPEFVSHYQAGVFRYRLTDAPSIQTASVLGHSRYGEEADLVFERSLAAREYTLAYEDLEQRGEWLDVTLTDGTKMRLQRLGPAAFPKRAIRALEQGLERLPRDPTSPADPRTDDGRSD